MTRCTCGPGVYARRPRADGLKLAIGDKTAWRSCQEIERDMGFDKIESPEDVMLWMAVGLPTALYNSSTALPGLGFDVPFKNLF